MRNLSLVKSLTRFKEEKRHSDEISLETIGLSIRRGNLIELAGDASAGKTSITLSLLSKLTRAGEICAVVDSGNGFDPNSAFLAGVDLKNLLWVMCGHDIEKAFMSADHLVQAKGFGAVWLNLSGLTKRELQSVPRTYWYRYRTRVNETPTILLVTAEEPVTGTASQQSFVLSRKKAGWSGQGRYKLLKEMEIDIHSRKEFYGSSLPAKIKFDYTDV